MPRRLRLARSIAVAFLASVLVPFAVAQSSTERKPPRRLPPTGSQTTAIPAGVDSGTPATSDSMPLGTPVPPAVAADRNDQNKRSAAARAAARPAAAGASGVITEAAAASEAGRPPAAASAVRPARSRTPSPPAR